VSSDDATDERRNTGDNRTVGNHYYHRTITLDQSSYTSQSYLFITVTVILF